MVKQLKFEGQLDKLASLISAGCTRVQSRNILRISDEDLDELLHALASEALDGEASTC